MTLSSLKPTLALAALLALPSLAHAHFDFVPSVSAGKIVTGGHDDEAGTDVPSLRVAGYDFGEEPSDPYNLGDPGFNAVAGSGFTGGSTLRLAGTTYNGAYLSYWNGAGTPTFTPAAADISISLTASPTRRATFTASTLAYTPTTDTSILIGTFAGNGALHAHLGSSIFANGAQLADSVPVGAYLLAFTLTNPGTGVIDSDPLYVIYNNGLTEDQHDLAINTLTATLVPEPTTAALTLPAATLLLRRRRR